MDNLTVDHLINIIRIKKPNIDLENKNKDELIDIIVTLFPTSFEIDRILADDMFEEEVADTISPNPDQCPSNFTLNKNANAWFNCSIKSDVSGYSIFIVPENMRFYYASFMFKEQTIYERMYGIEESPYPTRSNFFLTSNAEAQLYTKNTLNIDNRYGKPKLNFSYREPEVEWDLDIPDYKAKSFDLMHVYKTNKELKLFNLYDKTNIYKLLYDNEDSPFHISKRSIPLSTEIPVDTVKTMINDDHNTAKKMIGSAAANELMMLNFLGMSREELNSSVKPGYRDIAFVSMRLDRETGFYQNTSINVLSGFILLQIATSYHLIHPKISYMIKRRSSYAYDFHIANNLKTYLSLSGSNIQGWGVPKLMNFHSEICIFRPDSTNLIRDKDSILDWENGYPFMGSVLRKKAAILDNYAAQLRFSQQELEKRLGWIQQSLDDFTYVINENNKAAEIARKIAEIRRKVAFGREVQGTEDETEDGESKGTEDETEDDETSIDQKPGEDDKTYLIRLEREAEKSAEKIAEKLLDLGYDSVITDEALTEIKSSIKEANSDYHNMEMQLKHVMNGGLIEEHLVKYLKIEKIPVFPVYNRLLRLVRHKRHERECKILHECEKSIGKCNMDKIIKEMRKYPNRNTVHHRGETVADHCIWVARCLRNWMKYENEPWTHMIHDEMKNVTVVAGFLHDIGKIGDNDFTSLVENGNKPKHPHLGFLYKVEEIPFKSEHCSKDTVNSCYCEASNEEEIVINICIAMHHFLGEVLIKYGMITAHLFPSTEPKGYTLPNPGIKNGIYDVLMLTGEHLSGTVYTEIISSLDPELKYYYTAWYIIAYLIRMNVLDYVIEKPKFMEQLLYILFAVSAADVFGAHPVEKEEPKDMDPYYLQFLSADTRSMTDPSMIPVPPLLRPYYKFMYFSIGLEERDNFMNVWSTIKDHRKFYDSWQQIASINHNSLLKISPFFRFSHGIHTVDDWIAAFIRVLRTGEVPQSSERESTFDFTSLEEKLGNSLTERSANVLKKFKFMKPPGLKKTLQGTGASHQSPV